MQNVPVALAVLEREAQAAVCAATLRDLRAHASRFAEALEHKARVERSRLRPIDNEIEFFRACGASLDAFPVKERDRVKRELLETQDLLEYAQALVLKIEARMAEQQCRPALPHADEVVKGLHPTIGAAILPFVRPRSWAAANGAYRPLQPDAA